MHLSRPAPRWLSEFPQGQASRIAVVPYTVESTAFARPHAAKRPLRPALRGSAAISASACNRGRQCSPAVRASCPVWRGARTRCLAPLIVHFAFGTRALLGCPADQARNRVLVRLHIRTSASSPYGCSAQRIV